jgi:hypothetical protein
MVLWAGRRLPLYITYSLSQIPEGQGDFCVQPVCLYFLELL